MDIDPKTPSVSSPQNPMAPPTEQPIILPYQLAALNNVMNREAEDWKDQMTVNSDTTWRRLCRYLLSVFLLNLGGTPLARHMNLDAYELVKDFSEAELEQLKDLVQKCVKEETWEAMFGYPKLQKETVDKSAAFVPEKWETKMKLVAEAYKVDYLGGADKAFLEYLTGMNTRFSKLYGEDTVQLYAKIISVVQSSATGKSRMLTEVGRSIFTLPICLREKESSGHPLGDHEIHRFFLQFWRKDDLPYGSTKYIAAFLAAAHQTMLEELQALESKGFTGTALRAEWHRLMELDESRDFRKRFFEKVLATGTQIHNEMAATPGLSPKRNKGEVSEQDHPQPLKYAEKCYNQNAKLATENLMTFISKHIPGSICITYFDEVHNLGEGLWTMARLLSLQEISTAMWYVFMGTQSKISYDAPPQSPDQGSLRLATKAYILPRPYFGLGFDLNISHEDKSFRGVTVSELQSIKHLCKYGRPIWKAQYREGEEKGLIDLAANKLTCGTAFNPRDKHHVFAVLSQRICIDALLSGSEAQKLAENSVANHMRMLTEFPRGNKLFTTWSPSEPLLTLGACMWLYSIPPPDPPLPHVTHSHWSKVLRTFCQKLCDAGLVEKGLLGELLTRTLLVIARDFATDRKTVCNYSIPNLLLPVPLVKVFDKLLDMKHIEKECLKVFQDAFASASVNYTHWMITRDHLPQEPDKDLLKDLWTRGVALQCSFNQESLDCLIPIYFGSIEPPTDAFCPSKLSAVIIQVKYRIAADSKAEAALAPIGFLRDPQKPLPYLALLWELSSGLQAPEDCIQLTTPDSTNGVEFKKLVKDYQTARNKLENHETDHGWKERDPVRLGLEKEFKETRNKRDNYNRYSLTIRGVSPKVCKILEEADIANAFQSLFTATMPDREQVDNKLVQTMRPLDRIGPGGSSPYREWTMNIQDDDMMDVT